MQRKKINHQNRQICYYLELKEEKFQEGSVRCLRGVIKGTEESTLDLASSFRRILLTIAKLCVGSPILQCMEFCLVF